MENRLFQQLQTINQPNQITSIKKMMNMLKGKPNANQIIKQMAGQNPQINQVLNMVNGSGMSAKNLFYQIAQQKGINPNDVINQLK